MDEIMTSSGDVAVCLKLPACTHNRLGSSLYAQMIKKEFVDVTLVCYDGILKVHKNVLANSSAYFSMILKENPTASVVVLHNNIELKSLEILMKLIYCGVAYADNCAAAEKIIHAAISFEFKDIYMDANHLNKDYNKSLLSQEVRNLPQPSLTIYEKTPTPVAAKNSLSTSTVLDKEIQPLSSNNKETAVTAPEPVGGVDSKMAKSNRGLRLVEGHDIANPAISDARNLCDDALPAPAVPEKTQDPARKIDDVINIAVSAPAEHENDASVKTDSQTIMLTLDPTAPQSKDSQTAVHLKPISTFSRTAPIILPGVLNIQTEINGTQETNANLNLTTLSQNNETVVYQKETAIPTASNNIKDISSQCDEIGAGSTAIIPPSDAPADLADLAADQIVGNISSKIVKDLLKIKSKDSTNGTNLEASCSYVENNSTVDKSTHQDTGMSPSKQQNMSKKTDKKRKGRFAKTRFAIKKKKSKASFLPEIEKISAEISNLHVENNTDHQQEEDDQILSVADKSKYTNTSEISTIESKVDAGSSESPPQTVKHDSKNAIDSQASAVAEVDVETTTNTIITSRTVYRRSDRKRTKIVRLIEVENGACTAAKIKKPSASIDVSERTVELAKEEKGVADAQDNGQMKTTDSSVNKTTKSHEQDKIMLSSPKKFIPTRTTRSRAASTAP